MALPNLSDADRAAALKVAAEARKKRAQLRAELKSGSKSFAQVMNAADDPIVARMKVSALLESLPGYGKAKALKLMTEFGISESRRVQGLGARQREQLLSRLG
ncbi:MAG: integration host factor [Coriobacteriia bacterium]|nr:integration host factor [Coriobacteriia bacterium]